MRTRLKRTVERVLVGTGLADRLSHRQKNRRLILAYHNVVPEESRPWGESSLHITAPRFRAHLQVLNEAADVVSLRTLLEGQADRSGKPRVAITFDDGYRGAVTLGANELQRLGLSATFFVTPGLCREKGFWWDRLADPAAGILDRELRRHCLGTLNGRQHEVLRWAQLQGLACPPAPEPSLPASEDELRSLKASGSFDIQCHTWSHPNLVQLSSEERREEFRRASDWITRCSARPSQMLSYPYGLESRQVRQEAESFGYRWGLRVSGGWIPRQDPPAFALPRLNVPSGLSPEGLRLRLAGIGVA